MMKETGEVQVEVSTSDGQKDVCMLAYKFGRYVEMSASCAVIGSVSVAAGDLFEALSLIRLELEKYGYLLLCSGARVDAYPSRMSRQMGGGKVYLLRNGKSAQRDDLRGLFEPAELKQVGTVVAQQLAYESWLRSLRL